MFCLKLKLVRNFVQVQASISKVWRKVDFRKIITLITR